MTKHRLALAIAAGALTTALVGGAAFAAFQPLVTDQTIVPGPATTADKGPIDHLKQILDPLVQKGTLTQAQEDAILQAWKDATPSAKPRPFIPGKPGFPGAMGARGSIGDVLKASSDYLGVPTTDLLTQLKAGKSLADIAAATAGKSRQGLVDALTKAASDRIDQAVQNKKLTPDQAAKLKAKLATEIGRLVDHKGGARPGFPHKPTPSPSPKS